MDARRQLDVHVLVLPDTRKAWQRACIRSVEDAVSRAAYPVHVHIVPGIPGHLGRARAAGYGVGDAPWKCYVDDDDYILPEAFEVLGQHLDKDVAAIFPREYVEQNGRRHAYTVQRHHLWPVRTEIVQAFDHAAWPSMPDEMLRRTAASDPRGVLDLEEVLYVHRMWAGQRCRALRKANRAEVARVMGGAK